MTPHSRKTVYRHNDCNMQMTKRQIKKKHERNHWETCRSYLMSTIYRSFIIMHDIRANKKPNYSLIGDEVFPVLVFLHHTRKTKIRKHNNFAITIILCERERKKNCHCVHINRKHLHRTNG